MPMAKKKQGMSFEMMMQNMEINPRQLYRRSSWKKTRTTYDYVFMMCEEELNEIQGVGEVLAKAFVGYFADAKHVENFRRLLNELTIPEETVTKQQIFEGVNFVITGSVKHFANRGEVKELIESLGGKVTGSVTSKTNYLINNDVTSTSSKNKKANELGIPIISEETFLELVNQGEA